MSPDYEKQTIQQFWITLCCRKEKHNSTNLLFTLLPFMNSAVLFFLINLCDVEYLVILVEIVLLIFSTRLRGIPQFQWLEHEGKHILQSMIIVTKWVNVIFINVGWWLQLKIKCRKIRANDNKYNKILTYIKTG